MTLTGILPFKHDQAPGRASDDSYPTTLEFQVKEIACSSDGRSTNAYSVSTTGTSSTTSKPAQSAQPAQPAQSAQPLAQGELLVTTLLYFSLLCDQIYAPLFK